MSKRGRIMVDDEMKKYYFAVITIVAIVAIVGVVLAANGAKRDYSTTSQNKDIIGKASSFIKDSSEANLRMILQNQKDEWIKYQQEHKEKVSIELQRNNYIKDMVTSGEDFLPHAELTAEKERVAKDAREEVKETLIESEQRTKMSCSEGEQLPLNLFFADYTIDTDGITIIYDGGFNAEQREQMTRFLCKMLFVLSDVYYGPFDNFDITLVRDLYYSGSNVFIPSTMEIHTDGKFWNPRLLTHEFVHAFRGNRLLTSDSDWNYDPTLSGFEEGFGEGIAYLAMNEYIKKFKPLPSDPDVPGDVFYMSLNEWNYDFLNDHSMENVNFWSDRGGTYKSYQRYLMSAAAIMRLEVAIPNFSRRFNEIYYGNIRENPLYKPSRENIIKIIEELTNSIDGISPRQWIDKQKIFASKFKPGKTDWFGDWYLTPVMAGTQEPWDLTLYLHFVENFPNGNNWAYYTDCGNGRSDYVFHRLNATKGLIVLSSTKSIIKKYNIFMKEFESWFEFPSAKGCTEAYGFNTDVIWFKSDQTSPPPIQSEDLIGGPVIIDLSDLHLPYGIYKMSSEWQNPHFSRHPNFDLVYDKFQRKVSNEYYILIGLNRTEYENSNIFGGIKKGGDGRIRISHSETDNSIELDVINGAFYGNAPWVRPYSDTDDYLVTIPGTLTFEFKPKGSKRVFSEKRTIIFGLGNGKHHFLLN